MAGDVSVSMPLYRVGTLSYTKRALVVLFMWLLWGDLCFTLMEIIEPSVLPFILKAQGASNFVMSVYITTIAGFFNLTVCPISSFWSDRYRSRKGRRLPFLVYSTPFVGLFLILTGFSREIGGFFYRSFFQHSGFTQAGVSSIERGLLLENVSFCGTDCQYCSDRDHNSGDRNFYGL